MPDGQPAGCISIHAPREGGDYSAVMQDVTGKWISIHAPREGGDSTHRRGGDPMAISIHAPREGGDHDTEQNLEHM